MIKRTDKDYPNRTGSKVTFIVFTLFLAAFSLILFTENPSFAHKLSPAEDTDVADMILNNRSASDDKREDLLKPVESTVASVKAIKTLMKQTMDTASLLPKESEKPAAKPVQPAQITAPLKKTEQLSKKDAKGLSWPVDGFIYSTFNSPRGKNRKHGAIDIVTKKGTPIAAAMDGIVAVSANGGKLFRGYGKIIIINHCNGIHTVYSHCDTILVKMGQRVKRGEFIATVGRTGRATTDHLHFEVRVAGVKQDPLKHLPERPHMVKALNYRSNTKKN